MIRVLVAEDSPTVRELLVEILQSEPDIRVVGQARNGVEAVDMAARLRPDLITMDIHMPDKDGLEATREIMTVAPTPIIIVTSSTSKADVHRSFDAMQAGALMLMPKPDNPASALFDGQRTQFLTMARAMSQVKVVRRWPSRVQQSAPVPRQVSGTRARSRLVAVAASTGGPSALQHIFSHLPRDFAAPIVVVQHIADGFAGGLVGWLGDTCGLSVRVAEDGEPLRERTVFVAPDGLHVGVTAGARVVVSSEPPVRGFRPSGTYLFESAARAYGASVAAVILTGMGNDGVEGLRAVHAAGGYVMAQDEASSVVYGMPREAAEAGVVDAVLGLDAMADRLRQLVSVRTAAESRVSQ